MAPSFQFQILEINLISAEDLAPVSKNMKTYAMAWVGEPDRKLATGVDQTGGTDPTWNEKLTFQVDDKFLNSEDAKIVVEIYAAAWLKDALIGQVSVLIEDIFHLRSVADTKTTTNNNNSAARTVTLQIRRPSGRPQGILNMEVSIIKDGKLPQNTDEPKPKITRQDQKEDPENKTESINHESIEDSFGKTPETKCSAVNDGSGSSGSPVKGNGSNSMVNGDSVCCSDVGPSASVVAAAIAKGLYVPPANNQPQSKETSKIIREWTKKEREQDLERKLERWRSEVPATAARKSGKSSRRSREKSHSTGDGKKLFSCFGNAFGCEISITFGGGKKKHGNGGNGNKICHLGSVDGNFSNDV